MSAKLTDEADKQRFHKSNELTHQTHPQGKRNIYRYLFGKYDHRSTRQRDEKMYENKNKLTENSQDLRKNMTKEEKHLWYDFLKKAANDGI